MFFRNRLSSAPPKLRRRFSSLFSELTSAPRGTPQIPPRASRTLPTGALRLSSRYRELSTILYTISSLPPLYSQMFYYLFIIIFIIKEKIPLCKAFLRKLRSIKLSQCKEIKPTSIFAFAVLQSMCLKVAATIPFQQAVRRIESENFSKQDNFQSQKK